MKIGIANDHGGYELKFQLINKLEEKGYEIINYGSDNNERVDYPVYAFKLCQGVISKNIDFGIAICKTGIGMSIACNKVKGIRCAKIDNEIDAEYSKRHNNANVIAKKNPALPISLYIHCCLEKIKCKILILFINS